MTNDLTRGNHREMTISRRFIVTSATSVVLLLCLAAVALLGSRSAETGIADLAENSVPSLSAALTLKDDVNTLRLDYWRHMASNRPEQMDQIEAEIQKHMAVIDESLAVYRKTMDDNDRDRTNLEHMTANVHALEASWPAVRVVSRTGDTNKAVDLYDAVTRPKALALADAVLQTLKYNQDQATQRSAAARNAAAHSLSLSLGLSLMAICLSIGISSFMIRSTNKVLRESTDELADGTDQVAGARPRSVPPSKRSRRALRIKRPLLRRPPPPPPRSTPWRSAIQPTRATPPTSLATLSGASSRPTSFWTLC